MISLGGNALRASHNSGVLNFFGSGTDKLSFTPTTQEKTGWHHIAMVRNGQIVGCTRMMCVTQNTPRCLAYNTLNLGDICYRFCEDNSEPMINLMNNCPQDSICTHRPSTVGYDSCGSNAWRCVQSH